MVKARRTNIQPTFEILFVFRADAKYIVEIVTARRKIDPSIVALMGTVNFDASRSCAHFGRTTWGMWLDQTHISMGLILFRLRRNMAILMSYTIPVIVTMLPRVIMIDVSGSWPRGLLTQIATRGLTLKLSENVMTDTNNNR